MTGSRRFWLHPGAARDIEEIWQFISVDSLDAAGGFREELLEAIRSLATLPHQGHFRPDLTSRPLRFQSVRDFLIAYAPEETPIAIIGVIHGRRNPRIIAAILHARS